jgi:hypothetical protein
LRKAEVESDDDVDDDEESRGEERLPGLRAFIEGRRLLWFSFCEL